MALMISAGYWWMGMSGDHYMMMGFSFGLELMLVLATLGAVCGVVVLASAILLNARPRQATTWGAIILAFSLIGLVGMGGFFVGAVLGIVGGVLALTWQRPSVGSVR
ncbi:MAG: hypothetical protein JET69_00320 [Methanomassiliicoccales archaeon]|nr:hypothetical protein [Methanomassiliicoccales archaeon]